VDPDQYGEVLRRWTGRRRLPRGAGAQVRAARVRADLGVRCRDAGYLAGTSVNGAPRALPSASSPSTGLLHKLRYARTPARRAPSTRVNRPAGSRRWRSSKREDAFVQHYLDIEASALAPPRVSGAGRGRGQAPGIPPAPPWRPGPWRARFPWRRRGRACRRSGDPRDEPARWTDAAAGGDRLDLPQVVVAPSRGLARQAGEDAQESHAPRGAGSSSRRAGPLATRSLLGGLLAETLPGPPQFSSWMAVTPGSPPEAESGSAIRVARDAARSSRTRRDARDGCTLGIGAGSPRAWTRCALALLQGRPRGAQRRGRRLCSDGFLSFPDSVDMAAKAGITAIAQPGGRPPTRNPIAAAESRGLTCF